MNFPPQIDWEGPIGRDCINLQSTMAKWLGERLNFLAKSGNGYPGREPYNDWESWSAALKRAGEALIAYHLATQDPKELEIEAKYKSAQIAMLWVTQNMGDLWD